MECAGVGSEVQHFEKWLARVTADRIASGQLKLYTKQHNPTSIPMINKRMLAPMAATLLAFCVTMDSKIDLTREEVSEDLDQAVVGVVKAVAESVGGIPTFLALALDVPYLPEDKKNLDEPVKTIVFNIPKLTADEQERVRGKFALLFRHIGVPVGGADVATQALFVRDYQLVFADIDPGVAFLKNPCYLTIVPTVVELEPWSDPEEEGSSMDRRSELREKAVAGDRKSQVELAVSYLGRPSDLVQAYCWFQVAVSDGANAAIIGQRDEIGKLLSEAELATARQCVEEVTR